MTKKGKRVGKQESESLGQMTAAVIELKASEAGGNCSVWGSIAYAFVTTNSDSDIVTSALVSSDFSGPISIYCKGGIGGRNGRTKVLRVAIVAGHPIDHFLMRLCIAQAGATAYDDVGADQPWLATGGRH